MKSIYYVALTVRAYRKAIDALEGKISDEQAKPFVNELYNASHREFGTGFFYGQADANKTTTGASDSPFELCAAVGPMLDDKASDAVFELAETTEKNRVAELEAMHPAARKAKEADYALHPEKRPSLVQKR